MAKQTVPGTANLEAFIISFLTFAENNAGFAAAQQTFADPVDSRAVYWTSRTTNGLLTYWTFKHDTNAMTVYGDDRVEARMMSVEPTELNYNTSTVGQPFFTFMATWNLSPPFIEHIMYSDGDSVFLVLQVQSNLFAHLCFGNVQKVGDYTGGEFLQGNNFEKAGSITPWRPLVSGPHDSATMIFGGRENRATAGMDETGRNYIRNNISGANDGEDYTPFGASTVATVPNAQGTMPPNNSFGQVNLQQQNYGIGFFDKVQNTSPSLATQRAPLLPVYVYISDLSNDQPQPAGHVPNITSVNIKDLSPKDVVNTDWDVYPLAAKFGDTDIFTVSENWGVAYRNIP